jgi:putative redox protein
VALAELIDQTRTALTAQPAAGGVTFRATSTLVGVTEVDNAVRSHRFKADEPESLGGGDAAANPVEYVLAALGACQAISYRVWGEALGIPFDDVRVQVDGDLDVRGFFGVDETVRPGCGDIRVHVTLAGSEAAERYAELHAAVEAHCPVQDMLTGTVNIKAELELA